jgi:hypothetical protein
MRRIARLALAASLAAACSSGTPGGPPAPGCDLGGGLCLTGGTAQSCVAPGSWLAGGCPAESRVGTCVAAASAEVLVFYAPDYSPWTAEAACDGTWVPEPDPNPPPVGGGDVVSCALEGVACIELHGATSEQQADLHADCAPAPYYTWSESGCALDGALAGYCEFDPAEPGYGEAVARIFFSSAEYTLAEAQATCADQPGVWVY